MTTLTLHVCVPSRARADGQSAWEIVRSMVVGYIEDDDDEEGKEGETDPSERLEETEQAPFDTAKITRTTRMPSVLVAGKMAITSETVVSHDEIVNDLCFAVEMRPSEAPSGRFC